MPSFESSAQNIPPPSKVSLMLLLVLFFSTKTARSADIAWHDMNIITLTDNLVKIAKVQCFHCDLIRVKIVFSQADKICLLGF